MTRILSLDGGKNSGISLGYYDALTPYRLLERWQVHGGVRGFLRWATEVLPTLAVDEIVVERFVLSADNEFTAELQPVEIDGAIETLMHLGVWPDVTTTWLGREKKGSLTGYPATAKTKAQRQRIRFDFLERFGLFKPGTENDDSNDSIVQALVYLKLQRHYPTMITFWPPTRHLTLVQDKAAA